MLLFFLVVALSICNQSQVWNLQAEFPRCSAKPNICSFPSRFIWLYLSENRHFHYNMTHWVNQGGMVSDFVLTHWKCQIGKIYCTGEKWQHSSLRLNLSYFPVIVFIIHFIWISLSWQGQRQLNNRSMTRSLIVGLWFSNDIFIQHCLFKQQRQCESLNIKLKDRPISVLLKTITSI